MIECPLQKLPKNGGDLGNLIVAKGFKKLPKLNYTLKLFIAFKMAYSCVFSIGGNPDFPKIPSKKVLKHQLLLEDIFQ